MSSRNVGITIGLVIGLIVGYFLYPMLNMVYSPTPQTGAIQAQLDEALDTISELEGDLESKDEVIQAKQAQINQLQGRITQLQTQLESIPVNPMSVEDYEALEAEYNDLVDTVNEILTEFPDVAPLDIIYENEFDGAIIVYGLNFTSTGESFVVRTSSTDNSPGIAVMVTSTDQSVGFWNATINDPDFYEEFTLPPGEFTFLFSAMHTDMAITFGTPRDFP